MRTLEPGASPAKFLVFGARTRGYEIAREFLHIAATASGQPVAVLPPERTLELRAKRFAMRAGRPEQAAFRARIFVAFKAACAITRCSVDAALDAAHMTGRKWGDGHNTASDGWLLRKDLHALYDAGLLDIGVDGSVDLSADAATRAHYPELQGRHAYLPGSDA